MFQEIAVILIGIGVAVYVGWKIYTIFTTIRVPGSPCAGCRGCELKNQIHAARKSDDCPAAAPEGISRRNRAQPKKRNTCGCS